MESSKLGSTWYMISYDIAPWKHPGGDWKDKNFIPQGTTPWATSIPIQNIDTEQKITFDVTDLLRNQLTP